MKKPVLVMFGGLSAEHEVSVVTGLQALENIDTTLFDPLAVFVSKQGEICALPGLRSRKGYTDVKRPAASFGKDAKGGYLSYGLSKKVYPYAAYLAFHGGTGEGGAYQGLLTAIGIPFTSPSHEASAIAMNKQITKEVLRESGIPTSPSARVFARDVESDAGAAVRSVLSTLTLPVIVKPAHLGSSVGISVAKTEVELEKKLIEAAAVDAEILIEPFYSPIAEYNCAVRTVNGNIEASPIEHPLSHDEILSFADKYERGGKKAGAGMASLSRELPAKISEELRAKISDMAVRAYAAARMKGLVRIDFMVVPGDELFLTEINTIPGSMSFYLWEAAGIPYKQFNTELIEEAVTDAKRVDGKLLDYTSDIVERFVGGI